jgi:hypothetical protein
MKHKLGDEEIKAIEEERAINRKLLCRQEIKTDLQGLAMLFGMFGVIWLTAELKSVIPRFCYVLGVAIYIIGKFKK